jgi:RNA polymerase sigma-70 factor, ECF subfamily
MLKKEYSNYSDANLIADYHNGRVRAFDYLVSRYKKILFSYLLRMVNNREVAEDLFQEIFMKVSMGLNNYSERKKFRNWLFGIAYRVVVDYQRKNSKVNNQLENISLALECQPTFYAEEIKANPANNMEQKELQKILNQAIGTLPVEQKQVLLLKEHSGLTFREIADLVNRPLNTVLAQNRYALIQLKKILTKKYGKEIQHVLQ